MIEINETKKGFNAKYLIDYSTVRNAMEFTIMPHAEVVYYDQKRKEVLHPYNKIQMFLTIRNIRDLCAVFIDEISVFLASDTRKIYKNVIINTLNGYIMILSRDLSKNIKDRIVLTIKDAEKTVIVLRLRKTSIIFLLNWIKMIFEDKVQTPFNIPVKQYNDFVTNVGRDSYGLLRIRSVSFYQKEMDILRYMVDEMLYGFKPDKIFKDKMIYKKIDILFDRASKTVWIVVKKNDTEEKEVYIKVDSQILAALYLSIPERSQLQEKIPQELSSVSYVNRQNKVFFGFEVKKEEKYNLSTKKGGLRFQLYDNKSKSKFLNIDMGSMWNLFLATLSGVYNSSSAFFDENGNHASHWRIKTLQPSLKNYFIEIRIFADIKYKKDVTMLIRASDKHVNSKDSLEFNAALSFKRHQLHSFISMFLSASIHVDNFTFEYSHKNVKTRKIKFFNYEGSLSLKNNSYKSQLCLSDSSLLKVSAKNKIFYDRWITFQGEEITINSNGVITDMKYEYEVNQKEEHKIAIALYLLFFQGKKR